MTNSSVKQHCRVLAIGLLTLVTAALYAPIAVAQQTQATIDIQDQPLADALVTVSDTFGVSVLTEDETVRGRRAAPTKGTFTVVETLNRLLVGTSLTARQTASGSYIVEEASSTSVKPVSSEQESDDAPIVDELIVYGTKKELTLQNTQTSVELFTQERINREVIFSLDDILLRTPNVSMDNVQTGFSIRGVEQVGVGSVGRGETSNIFVDGVPVIGSRQAIQSAWDVQQVEILRGPQSTVQGRNSLAGAIVMRSNDPSYDWEGRVRLIAGSQETEQASIAFGGPIIDEQVAFRLAYDNQSFNGDLVEVTTGLDQQFNDSEVIRGKLLIEPNALPGLRVELLAERVDTDFGDFNFVTAQVPFNDPAYAEFDVFGGQTFNRVNIQNVEADRYVIDATYSLNEHWDIIGLFAGENANIFRQFGIPINGAVRLDPSDSDFDVFSGEIRLAFDYERFSGWFGLFRFTQDVAGVGEFSAPLAAFGLPVDPVDSVITSVSISSSEVVNDAVFAELSYDLTDQWQVSVGARYDTEDFSDPGADGEIVVDPPTCTVTLPIGVVPCIAIFPFGASDPVDASYNAFLPRIGITYRFDDDRSLSLGIQRGYRAGGSVVVIDDLAGAELVEYDPEFVTNYEVAFRSQWLNQRLTLNANLFFTDWEDQQVSVPGLLGDPRVGRIVNAGASEIYGIEIHSTFKATDNLDVFAGLGLLETEFTDFPFSPVPGDLQNLRGNAFTTAPKLTAALAISYRHDSGFYAEANANYRGEQFSDVANTPENQVGSYTLINARAGFRFEHWQVGFFANNLFDERFITEQNFVNADPGTGTVNIAGNAQVRVNQPRVAGVSIEYQF